MTTRALEVIVLGLLGSFAGCDGTVTSDASDPDGERDPVLCTALEEEAADTLGCNGGILGPLVADGAFGGRCMLVEGGTPQGTCVDASAECATIDGLSGVCLVPCAPQATFVSASDCPGGSRCFTFAADRAVCYPDCTSSADCTTGACDDDGSCIPTEPEA